MRTVLIIIFVYASGSISSQQIDSLSARQIIDESIKFCGGEENISKIRASELSYVYLTEEGKKASIFDKRINGKKYSQSILSSDFQAQSTFFNGHKLVQVNGDIIKIDSDITETEEIKLRTYNHAQYGYVQEGYDFKRLPDEEFNHFQCYLVQATTKNGYSTINFFDKTNFRLLMIVYPSGSKSCMINYKFIDKVLFNSTIVNITSEKEQQELILLSAKNNLALSDLWFNCPYESTLTIPKEIKTGSFNPIDSSSTLERTDKTQTEIFDQGNSKINMHLTWKSEDTYFMADEKSLREKLDKPELEILVRIVSWDSDGYVCHFLAGDLFGNQEYKIMERNKN